MYDDSSPLVEWPACMPRAPWEHQHAAYSHLGQLWQETPGVALFSGMGTGKSLVALALIEAYGFRNTLILCPKSMELEWPDIIRAETSSKLRVVPLSGSKKEKAEKVRFFREDNTTRTVYVCNVESFAGEPLLRALLSYEWDCVIIDESQKIKSAGSKMSRAAHTLGRRAARRMILTGTPLHDKPLDIYGQYRFLDSRIFGTNFAHFGDRYATWKTLKLNVRIPVSYVNQEELSARIYSVAFRVTEDVLDLPELLDIEKRFVLESKADRAYNDIFGKLLLDYGQDGTLIVPNVLAKLGRLQQITSGFVPLTDAEGETRVTVIGTERKDTFRALLSDLPEDLPVVVFARYTHDLAEIRAVAEELGRGYFEQSGQRHEWREWREATGAEVIGVQIQAGGAGINLTRSPYAVFYSISYSLGDYQQALRRVYRPGQTRSTVIYHLTAAGKIDETIREALRSKEDVTKFVVEKLFGPRALLRDE